MLKASPCSALPWTSGYSVTVQLPVPAAIRVGVVEDRQVVSAPAFSSRLQETEHVFETGQLFLGSILLGLFHSFIY
jgi:hypothetical protein